MEGCYGEEGKEGESGQKNETPEEEVEFQGYAAPEALVKAGASGC